MPDIPTELKLLCWLDELMYQAGARGEWPSWLKSKSFDCDNNDGEIIIDVDDPDHAWQGTITVSSGQFRCESEGEE